MRFREGVRRRAGSWVWAGMPVLLAGAAPAVLAQEGQDAATLPEVEVRGEALAAPGPGDRYEIRPEETATTGVDAADLVGAQPGAAVMDNGPLAGQVHYRGLFGPRVATRVNGMYINSGGPNLMDPPLHYAPTGLVESVDLTRGIAPARHAAESIGGAVNAQLKRSRFGESAEPDFAAELSGGGRSAFQGGNGAGFASIANNRHRVHAMAATERGGDLKFPGGTIEASRHERDTFGGGYGVRLAPGHEFSFDVRHTDTEDTGNPSLPLDTALFDSNMVKADYKGSFGAVDVTAEFSFSDIEHEMDNVALRSGIPAPRQREVQAQSDGLGWRLNLARALGPGKLHVGFDGHLADHDMQIFNPSNDAFFVDNFADVDRNRFGGFLAWDGSPLERLDVSLDLRTTRISMDAGEVGPGAAPGAPPLQNLADDFNAADRDVSDTLVDWTAKLGYRLDDNFTLRLEGGRKTRAPSYIERFTWLPIEATAGLADFNNHVGDIGLDPEVAHEVGGGFDFVSAQGYFRPRVFYRDVDDFITGTPFDDTPGDINSDVERVSNANGDSTPLKFSNVGAEFYGFDLDYGYRFTPALRLDGQVTLTRGERTDIDDNIYRVPPAHGQARFSYVAKRWGAFVGTEWAVDEDRISETNNDARSDDPRTPGYAIFNVGARWAPLPGGLVQVGVNNLFDNNFEQQLAGFNRVPNSDVEQGARLPGVGRSFFVRVRQSF